MKTVKTKSPASPATQPIWCHRCCIRIAPYDLRTVSHGKDYHRNCFTKAGHSNGKSRKRLTGPPADQA